jgi:methylphosphotriester-DNA--protein-cysteine methyltransferase
MAILVAPGYKDVTSLGCSYQQQPQTLASLPASNRAIWSSALYQQVSRSISTLHLQCKVTATPLGITPTTYNGQVRMEQVVRDLHVFSSNIDFNKKLEINGLSC